MSKNLEININTHSSSSNASDECNKKNIVTKESKTCSYSNPNVEINLDSEIIYKSTFSDSNTYMGPPPLTKRLNIELENNPMKNIID
tara:strand:- start:8582 stop:8842 length:261 start_codon:yes stop_codon:yes gene_type:complete